MTPSGHWYSNDDTPIGVIQREGRDPMNARLVYLFYSLLVIGAVVVAAAAPRSW